MAKPDLNWEYCECGCHGHECGPYWLYNDLKGNYRLHLGHGWISPLLKSFKSFKAASNYAARHYEKEADRRRRMFDE